MRNPTYVVLVAAFAWFGCKNDPGLIAQDAGIAPLQTQPYEVRLRGVNYEAFSYALFEVAEVKASASGVPLTVRLSDTSVDLAEVEHAWLLATVDVPETATFVEFTVRFDDVGAFESAGLAGPVDARHVTLRWRSLVSSLQLHGRTVVHLDVEDSLAVLPSGKRQLLPTVLVQH